MKHTRDSVETRDGEWNRSRAMTGHPFVLAWYISKTVCNKGVPLAVCNCVIGATKEGIGRSLKIGVAKTREEENVQHVVLMTEATNDKPQDEKSMFLMCRLNMWGRWEQRPPAILQPRPASGPLHYHHHHLHCQTPTLRSLMSSSATGQKLLLVKHESRGGGAEKKLGVCWRENSRGHELPAVVFKAELLLE